MEPRKNPTDLEVELKVYEALHKALFQIQSCQDSMRGLIEAIKLLESQERRKKAAS